MTKTEATTKVATRKSEILGEIEELVRLWQESAEFAEYKEMSRIDELTKAKVKEYAVECEAECFAELIASALTEDETVNPVEVMREAARRRWFRVIKVKDVKGEVGMTRTIDYEATCDIDILKLHKRVNGGIGYNRLWWSLVERYDCLLTAATAHKINAFSADRSMKLNPQAIKDTIAMSEECKKLDFGCLDAVQSKRKLETTLLSELQNVVDAMIGEGHEVNQEMVEFLIRAHEKTGRDSMTLTVPRAATFRRSVLAVCNSVLTGNNFTLDYKKAKRA